MKCTLYNTFQQCDILDLCHQSGVAEVFHSQASPERNLQSRPDFSQVVAQSDCIWLKDFRGNINCNQGAVVKVTTLKYKACHELAKPRAYLEMLEAKSK